VPQVTRSVYEILARRHSFDPSDKEAIGMWDTTEAEKFFAVFFGVFRAFLGIIGSFTLIVGGIGVSNIMYVVVEERTREIGIKLAVGAKPAYIQRQFLLETLTLTAVGGLLGFLVTLGVIAVFPAQLDEYVGTPEASPLVILTTGALLGLIGSLAGYFPARRASLLDPVQALKLS
jgi:putative ABC transport system permease protein